MPRNARAWIGTSGWNYKSWRDVLYPSGLPQREWLSRFSEEFNTVELNNSFYRIPSKDSVKRWSDEAPRRFRFAVKLWRGITHFKKLKQCEEYVDRFLQVADLFDPRQRAPLLVQLPPNLNRDLERLGSFLDLLKSKTGRGWKIAVEFRNEDWLSTDVYHLLDKHRAAICLHDMPGKAAVDNPNDASFVYFRRHGFHDGRYDGCYKDSQLQADAEAVQTWLDRGKTVFGYYNNDAHGYAVRNARALSSMLNGSNRSDN